MNRRAFLRLLLATPAAATFDFERALWLPGHTIAVPALEHYHVKFTHAWSVQQIAHLINPPVKRTAAGLYVPIQRGLL